MADALKKGLPDLGGDDSGVSASARRSRVSRDGLGMSEKLYPELLSGMGLKVVSQGGVSALVRASDGQPASQAQVRALGERILAEPRAQWKFPGFFEKVPRKDYDRMKEEHRARPELQGSVFQDVALSEGGRDFVWARSCALVSGSGCNPHAEGRPYKKGAYVDPKVLRGIWKGLRALDERDRRLQASARAVHERLSTRAGLPAEVGAPAAPAEEPVFAGRGLPEPAAGLPEPDARPARARREESPAVRAGIQTVSTSVPAPPSRLAGVLLLAGGLAVVLLGLRRR